MYLTICKPVTMVGDYLQNHIQKTFSLQSPTQASIIKYI